MTVYGRQTPTSCVYLSTPEDLARGKGQEAKQFYEKTGNKLLEWQEMLLDQMMAIGEDGLWVHQKFAYSVSRRNGKSESIIARCLNGLEDGEKGLYTAHLVATSHDFFMRVEDALLKSGYKKASLVKKSDDIPDDMIFDSVKSMGAEYIVLRKTGGRIDFRTRTSTGMLGTGYEYLIIDEAQEYKDDQQTALQYIISSAQNPQTILCGTPPTVVSAGTVFVKLRKAVKEGTAKYTGWAEWSVGEMTDVHDEKAWAMTNPSYGVILTARKVEAEINGDDLDFNIQRLGLWYEYSQQSAIAQNIWSRCKINFTPDILTGKLSVGIKFGIDGQNVALSIACKTIDGKVFVQCLKHAPVTDGIDWIADLCEKLDYSEVVSDGKAGQTILEDLFKTRKLKKLKFPNTSEYINANAVFEQSLSNNLICHAEQKPVDTCVTNCKKRAIGTGGGFGYSSILEGSDISVLDSLILANWSCSKAKERKPQKVRM